MTVCCPRCHQPLREVRAGVRLPVLKAAIFDAIKASGDIGISTDELLQELYRDRRKPRSRHTIIAHVCQINEFLAETKFQIRSDYHCRWYFGRRHRTFLPSKVAGACALKGKRQ